MVPESQVTFGNPVWLSGNSVGLGGGAVLSIAGVSPLWSLPTPSPARVGVKEAALEALSLVPEQCLAHRRLPLRQHWQTFPEGAASPEKPLLQSHLQYP